MLLTHSLLIINGFEVRLMSAPGWLKTGNDYLRSPAVLVMLCSEVLENSTLVNLQTRATNQSQTGDLEKATIQCLKLWLPHHAKPES